jgi:rhodanese-related sulfurtransferase
MDAAEVAGLCGRPDVVFADTRPAVDFVAGHVAGALHLPCDSSAQAAEEATVRLGLASTVVIYGAGTDDARAVAETLRRHGLDVDLRVLRGGFSAWEAQGLACAAGPCPDCALAGMGASHP